MSRRNKFLVYSTFGSAASAALFPIVFSVELNLVLAAAFMGGLFGMFFGCFVGNIYA